jgi:hypothetical protein
MYVNRLFPIATDLALVRAGAAPLRFRVHSDRYYQHTLHANRFQQVRYLEFTFQAPTVLVVIGNIYVYGNTRKIEKLTARSPAPEFGPPPELNRPVAAGDRRALLREWEELRIRSGMSYSEYERRLARRGLHPHVWSFDSHMELREREMRKDVVCSGCGRAATWQCASCEACFCKESCMKMTDAKQFGDAKRKNYRVCTRCQTWRDTWMTVDVPRFEDLKRMFLQAEYPFITNDYSLLNRSLPAMFVFEPPPGQSGVCAEAVLAGGDSVWNPVETYVSLTVVFKQTFALNSIEIECRYPVVLEFDFLPSLAFDPPMCERTIAKPAPQDIEICQILHFRVVGNPIEITEMRFFGRPVPLEPTDQGLRVPEGINKLFQRQVTVRGDSKGYQHEIVLQRSVTICGIAFTAVHNIAEIIMTYDTDSLRKGDRRVSVLQFVIPPDEERFTLAFPCDCHASTRIVLMYIPSSLAGWRLPVVQAGLIRAADDVSYRRAQSHAQIAFRS